MNDCSPSKPSHQCGSGLKNRYFNNKRLTPESFAIEQAYGSGRRHLLNRAIHGWGVVYGFKITDGAGGAGIKIGAGLGLDPCGRELLRTDTAADEPLRPDDLLLLDNQGQWIETEKLFDHLKREQCLLLRAHYAERYLDPVRTGDPCHCDQVEWFYACETIQFSLTPTDCEECCDVDEYGLKCACEGSSPCDDKEAVRVRGGRCLCEHLTDLMPGVDDAPCCLTRMKDKCGGERRIDLKNGIPLACVKVGSDCRTITVHEVCGPRRLVKGNDLLFDLIRGSDLTRIIDVGWKNWRGDPPTLTTFRKALGAPANNGDGYAGDTLWVRFSRPVCDLSADCFAITVLAIEDSDGWWETRRIPIVAVQMSDGNTKATMVTSADWTDEAINGKRNVLTRTKVRIEIEVRGDLILDKCGQAVDANAVGDRAVPSGNGTPGGTFLSVFRVQPDPTIRQGA